MNTTQQLFPPLTCQTVACTWCGRRHEQNTQYLHFPKIGKVSYEACCIAHDELLIAHITRKFESHALTPHILLAQTITNQRQEIGDLKQLIKEWQTLVAEGLTAQTRIHRRVWIASRAELVERTQKALLKEVK